MKRFSLVLVICVEHIRTEYSFAHRLVLRLVSASRSCVSSFSPCLLVCFISLIFPFRHLVLLLVMLVIIIKHGMTGCGRRTYFGHDCVGFVVMPIHIYKAASIP